MLSYQHAYHAGNPADVQKHALWAEVLHALTQKPKPLLVYETHAGRGLYPLSTPETQRGAEWQQGLGALPVSTLTGAYGKAVQACNPTGTLTALPGSPAVAAHTLRPTDALHLCELHPTEISHLHRWAKAHGLVHIHQQNGFAHVPALVKAGQRQAVLIDPSYEQLPEYTATLACAAQCLKRNPHATVAVWVPVLAKGKGAGRHQKLIDGLKALGAPATHLTLWQWGEAFKGHALVGSAMVVLGMPYGLEKPMVGALAGLAGALGLKRTHQTYTWLVGPK